MYIEVKLKDPKYCDGCPCINYDMGEGADGCNQGYWETVLHGIIGNETKVTDEKGIVRPAKCIEENGL